MNFLHFRAHSRFYNRDTASTFPILSDLLSIFFLFSHCHCEREGETKVGKEEKRMGIRASVNEEERRKKVSGSVNEKEELHGERGSGGRSEKGSERKG